MLKKIFLLITSLFIFGCNNSPKIEENKDFKIENYIGKWYEIKRFDHSFEKGLKKVTADYTLKNNGEIAVVNTGINKNGEEKKFYATAKKTEISNFFKLHPDSFPIVSASYKVAWISDDYRYAIVTSSSYKYLWFLSKEKTIPLEIYNFMIKKADSLGFDTNKLIDGQ